MEISQCYCLSWWNLVIYPGRWDVSLTLLALKDSNKRNVQARSIMDEISSNQYGQISSNSESRWDMPCLLTFHIHIKRHTLVVLISSMNTTNRKPKFNSNRKSEYIVFITSVFPPKVSAYYSLPYKRKQM